MRRLLLVLTLLVLLLPAKVRAQDYIGKTIDEVAALIRRQPGARMRADTANNGTPFFVVTRKGSTWKQAYYFEEDGVCFCHAVLVPARDRDRLVAQLNKGNVRLSKTSWRCEEKRLLWELQPQTERGVVAAVAVGYDAD